MGGGFDLSDEDLAKQFNALSAVLKGEDWDYRLHHMSSPYDHHRHYHYHYYHI